MRPIAAVACLVSLALPAEAAITNLICDATGEPLQVRSEGLSEKLGKIVVTCTGTPGGTVLGSMTLFLNSPVTNRLTGETLDIVMTAETDVGLQMVGGSPRLITPFAAFFDSFTFNVPANGRTSLEITNIRVAADSVGRQITAFMSTSGQSSIGIRNNPVTIGVSVRALYANTTTARIVCTGSLLPEEITFSSLVQAGTRFATIRIAEGTLHAFDPRGPGTTNGIRVVVRYSGFPTIARLFVPDVIAGSSAQIQTSAGDLGVPAAGGIHSPSASGGLVLARVRNADPFGGGDMPVYLPGPPGSGGVAFQAMGEVDLRNGAGYVVYEVVDSSPFAFETAQIPTFVSMPRNSAQDGTLASALLSFGPLSNIATASASAPIPRFRDVAPPVDCPVVNDCNASYFPKLFVDAPTPINFRAIEKTPGFFSSYIRVLNDAGGVLNWSTSIRYRSGAGWLKASPPSGVNNASIILSALPEVLSAGRYEADFTIDAGPQAGSRSYLVTIEVVAAAPQPPPQPAPQPTPELPRFWTVGNAANLTISTLVPGSWFTLEGTRLSGRSVSVTLDGIAATIVSASDGAITAIAPDALGLRPNAQLQVTVDGLASAIQSVPLGVAAPAIFPNGIFNQDGFRNSESNPENVGNFLQVFATGLPLASLGTISVRIHDRDITAPTYAGPAPSTPGTQQVNLIIPPDLPAFTTELIVCGTPLSDPSQRICSHPARVTIR